MPVPQQTAQLIVQIDGQTVQTISLAMSVLAIGRTPDNGLVLPHPLVARSHAELRFEASGAILTDLDSSSGTFIGETQLLPHQPQLLTDGTVFQIGPFTLAYRAAPADTSEAEPDAPVALVAEPAAVATSAASAPPAPRPKLPALRAPGPASRYLRDLPIVYHDNEFLGRYLLLFETLWEPLEQRQDYLDMYVDPRTCPADFLPWLASWLDLSFSPYWPEARLRRLLPEAIDLYRWRGTRYGLARMIELCTGLAPEITDDPAQPYLIHIHVAIVPESGVDRHVLEQLIQNHKPAHVGYTLES